MYQANLALEPGGELQEALRCGGKVHLFALLHQRADPIGTVAMSHTAFETLDHLVHARQRNDASVDWQAPRRLLHKLGNVHVAIDGERQSARNGRCRHHEEVGGATCLGL